MTILLFEEIVDALLCMDAVIRPFENVRFMGIGLSILRAQAF